MQNKGRNKRSKPGIEFIDKVGQRKMHQGTEFISLLYLTIYVLFCVVEIVARDFPQWILAILAMAWITPWIMFATKVGHHQFKSKIIILCLCFMFAMQVAFFHNPIQLMPYLYTIMIMAAWLSVERLVILPLLTGVVSIMMYIHYWIPKDFFEPSEFFLIISDIANMFILYFVLWFWTKNRNRSMMEMQKVIADLKEAEDSRDDFLANVSHEIRTPINTICGISEVLLQQVTDSEIRSNLFYIQVAGRNLTSVVSDILDFSEYQSGKIEIAKEEYNITSTINDIVDMSLAKLSGTDVDIVVDCDANIPSKLLGDEKKIRRIIMNLLDNAIKFTEQGCICLSIGFRREAYGINLIVEVRDSGMGMTDENVEKIFNNYSQIDSGRNRRSSGIGLGLAISQILVEKQGGVMNFYSKQGQGTTARIIIPQEIVDDNPIVQFEDKDKINLGLYINFEEYVNEKTRDAYTKSISRMVSQMQVKSHISVNLAEFKRRMEKEKYTHVFITKEEYEEAKEYFDELANETFVIVTLYREEEDEIKNPKLYRLYKPFYIFPIVAIVKGSLRGGIMPVTHKKLVAKNVKALVVDDNLMNLKVMEGILQKYNIACVSANSGKAALHVIESKDYDIVFMDHMMPEMDGVETFHRIRATSGTFYQSVPIVALTANTVAGAREMFLKEGFSDFIEKPIENSVLERLLIRNLPEDKLIHLQETDEVIDTSEEYETQEEIQVGDLDKTAGVLFCGSEKKWLDVLRVCGETAEENHRQLKEFFETENWKEYIILIHGIKSSMRTVGATPLSEMAKALEKAGKANDFAYIKEHHQETLDEFDRVTSFVIASPFVFDQLQLENAEPEEENLAEYEILTEETFDEKIKSLENAMYEFDGNTMNDILQQLKKYQFMDVPLEKPLRAVIRKVEMSDYMSAFDTLVKLKGEIMKKQETGSEEV